MKKRLKFMALVLLALAGASACVYQLSMKWLKINRLTVTAADLPAELSGLKILHISDIHGNDPERINLDIWTAIDDIDANFACITGDSVVALTDEFLPHLEGLSRLTARMPVYYVFGNHDHLFTEEMKVMLEGAGVKTLYFETSFFKYNGVDVPVVGLPDVMFRRVRYTFYEQADKLITETPGYKIILSHEPQVFPNFAEYSPFLMLSGHTHGGQLRLPFLPTLYAPGQGFLPKYGDGLYTEGANNLYVSRGIGTTIFPIRFFNRPEIAIIELVKPE